MKNFINIDFFKTKWFKSFFILFLCIATITLLYSNTVIQMVRLWSTSETYTHGFIVPFISLWLIWRLREVWMNLEPQPSLKALPLIFIFSIFWFFGNLVAVNAVTQLSFVMMIALCIPAVLGWKIASIITFPIAFLFFAVPIGDFMLPLMMEWTADFTVVALQLTGIPVYREGLQFVIPSGKWSVVEACSGIRYLLASVTVGSLFAYLNYQSFKKRLIFVAISILIPLIANWLRAYMIVLIGHYSGNELATGVDHLVYGWIFFGIIIMLMLSIGMKWADSENILIFNENNKKIRIKSNNSKSKNLYIISLSIFLIIISPHIAETLMSFKNRELPVNIQEVAAADDWQSKNNILNKWNPIFSHSVDQYNKNYINLQGQEVGLHISYYRQQNYERKLVSSTNDILSDNKKNLIKSARNTININSEDGFFSIESTTLKYQKNYDKDVNEKIQAWKFYWVDEKFTANNIYAKILGALSKLKGQGDDSAIIVIYTNFSDLKVDIKDINSANNLLKKFFESHQKNIRATLIKTKNS